MIRELIIGLLLCSAFNLIGQDRFYIDNSHSSLVKVVDIDSNWLYYKPWRAQHKKTRKVSMNIVILVEYENGDYQSFPKHRTLDTLDRQVRAKKPIIGFKQNYLSFNPVHLIYPNLHFAYERLFKSGKYSLRFPLEIGLKNYDPSFRTLDLFAGYSSSSKVTWSAEAQQFFYPYGQRKASMFLGLGVEYSESVEFLGTGPNPAEEKDFHQMLSMKAYFGVKEAIGQRFFFQPMIGLGPRRYLDVSRPVDLAYDFNFFLGVNF